MIVLAIETACDDTAVAVVRDGHDVLSSIVLTETIAQRKYGGVVPELAARAQLELLTPAIREAIEESGVELSQIDALAVNNRHGLLRSIMVGVAGAKALSLALDLPLMPIHHIEGHIYSVLIENPEISWPHICLTVSGGHNLLLQAHSHGEYELLGRTLDDAVGEVYDKLARKLGLGFPGGLAIDRLAKAGKPDAYVLPRPMINDGTLDFSFSGLKTAVTRLVDDIEAAGSTFAIEDIAASFQAAVVDVLASKVLAAVRKVGASVVTVTGGVSANSGLRSRLAMLASQESFEVFFPSIRYCTDNAAMIACAAHYRGIGDAMGMDEALDAWSNAPLGSRKVHYSAKRQASGPQV